MEYAIKLQKVREALEDRNIQMVADRLQMSKTTIHAIKAGSDKHKARPTTVDALARYLGVNQ
jgi:hypothetical protein